MSVIDSRGYRANVGIILINKQNRLFWGRRVGQKSWQFPQGGMLEGESLEQTMYRELLEEVGLYPQDVKILANTEDWLYYQLPKRLIRYHRKPLCIGQKQKWFLLRLTVEDERINLEQSESPEFDAWRWVSYWYPIKRVINFKRTVYRKALRQFVPYVFEDEQE